MSEQTTDKPVAGRAVEGIAGVGEKAISQVQGAVVEASRVTENTAAGLIGYLKAANVILDAAIEGGIDVTQDVRASLLRELEEFNSRAHTALRDASDDDQET